MYTTDTHAPIAGRDLVLHFDGQRYVVEEEADLFCYLRVGHNEGLCQGL
jgi:hypothetical protein